MKIYIQRNIFVGLVFSIIVILGLALASYLYFNKVLEITKWAAHARRVLYHSEQVRSLSMEIETAQKGYGLTGNEVFLGPYNQTKSAIVSHLKELDSLTSDNDVQHDRIAQLQKAVTDRIEFSDEVIRVRKESFEKAKALVLTLRGKQLMDEIKSLLNAFQDEENKLVVMRSFSARKQFFQFVIAFLSLVGSTVVILIVVAYMINSNLRLRTQTEDKLKEAQEEAIKANKELESFSYSVSHDLRAPLRSINGYAQILKEDYGDKIDEEGNRTIDIISKNGRRMGQLIDDLLGFSRLGRQEIRKAKIDMDELVKSVLSELLEPDRSRMVMIHHRPLKNAQGDNNMIRQVWVNLLSNALKYSQKKEQSRIEISCMDCDYPSEIVYCVKDNGAGFDMQYEHKLFDVFHRLHKTADFEGTGVGLALSKRIIDRHKGRIWGEGKVNEGATFCFSLPKQ